LRSVEQLSRRALDSNHVYDDSRNPDTHTCLANLCVTPSFLAKLTDHDPEIRDLLRYRVWDIYGWRRPTRPSRSSPPYMTIWSGHRSCRPLRM
jgi:hypothetical protein